MRLRCLGWRVRQMYNRTHGSVYAIVRRGQLGMTSAIRASHVSFWLVVLGCSGALIAYVTYAISSFRPRPQVATQSCKSLPAGVRVGPRLTPSQLSGQSALHSQNTFFPTRFPYDRSDADWRYFQQDYQPGDSYHEYTTQFSGGYLILRHQCVIGQIEFWVI
jgi:hypothetical protein